MASRHSDLFSEEIFEKLPVEIVVFGNEFSLEYANQLARSTAFKFEDRNNLSPVSDDEVIREWGIRNLEEVRKTGKALIWEDISRGENREPQLIYRCLQPIRISNGESFLGYAFDITALRRNEIDLNQGRTIFSAFLQNMEALVFIATTEGEIVYLSDNVDSFFGGKASERLGEKMKRIGGPFIKNGERWMKEILALDSEKISRKVTWMSPEGEKVYKLDLEQIQNPLDGNMVFGSIVDITKKENYEKNLRESIKEANELVELKSNFINIVSHELRTPLAGMRTSLELLTPRIENLKDEKAMAHLNRISAQVERMSEMMRDVIDMNRLGVKAGELELVEVDLVDKLQEIIRYLLDMKYFKRKVHLRNEVERLRFLTDEKAFNTIFTNLIDNALKFSPNKAVEVFLAPSSRGVIIRVVDYGVGIPQGDHSKLFQSFSRAVNAQSFEGTGLGLVIVKRYVELLNGSITFESKPGNTTFTVSLPIIQNNLQKDF